ncbi:flagellar filament capping protein FliD [Chitinispirillales bacterium ANBcel5]|uniref:flagellar filament capping protein FliD n=1 Tax=Cellulosispirillum alkaliphilum TaxID=3039283 RepID=UPI002A562663|nr:flagellar filament capping protein FliD [Chitinispirillales bacterium ANBcel5]
MGISINGPSGIDTGYIIESLVNIEYDKVRAVEVNKSAYQVRIDAYSSLQGLLSDIQSKASELSKITSFDVFNTHSTNESVATISGGTGSVDGSYDVRVFQTAEYEKMASVAGRVTSQNTSLSELGIGVGEISVDGASITINETDTIQDLRMKINNATNEDGRPLDVNASVMRVSDDDYRLILSSRNTGSEGIEYRDISGTTLQDLGIIVNAEGDKGNINQVLRSSLDIESQFESLVVGESITYSGTDHNGNTVSGTFIKNDSSTIEDLLKHIQHTYNDMVDVSVSENGELLISDKVTGSSALTMSSLSLGSTDIDIGIDAVGVSGAGVLNVGKDAHFSVEGIAMKSSTNSSSGFLTGVTLDIHGTSTERVTVSLDRDHDTIQEKFTDLINSYNDLLRFVKRETTMGDPTDEGNTRRGALAGDMTANNILNQVNSAFRQQFDLFDTSLQNFTMVGLKTDPKSGELSLDQDMFTRALEENLDDVMRLFVTTGISDNEQVFMGTSSNDTRSGQYIIEEIDDEHLRIRLDGTDEWFTSRRRVGDVVSFNEGPAKGLTITAPMGSIGDGQSTFTLSKGLSSTLDDTVSRITNSDEGLISLRQDSWRRSIKNADNRIDQLKDRIERYRARLVRQFTDMEQAMSQLQSQSMNMMQTLGNMA